MRLSSEELPLSGHVASKIERTEKEMREEEKKIRLDFCWI